MLIDYALEQGFARECLNKPNEQNITWINPSDGSEMIWIPPGEYVVGPERRRLNNPGFSMAKHPITNEQYADFLSMVDYQQGESLELQHPIATGAFLKHWTKAMTAPKKLVNHPVVYVAYTEALAYCNWVGLNLPNEYQWEMAAAGKEAQAYPWGGSIVHWATPYPAHVQQKTTCPVTEYEYVRSVYGCTNMWGNISEWCDTYEFTEVDEDDRELAIVKGSAYLRSRSNGQTLQHRRRLGKNRRNRWVGFRPACLLPVRPADEPDA